MSLLFANKILKVPPAKGHRLRARKGCLIALQQVRHKTAQLAARLVWHLFAGRHDVEVSCHLWAIRVIRKVQ